MGQQKQLKVIIVGASVSGLTLANCLEKAGIEYVLLEKGRNVVYEGGASIGLMANGLRIMDQLDAYEDIRKSAAPLHTTYHRSADGKSYASSSYMGSLEAKCELFEFTRKPIYLY
jgi:FAD dependent monooxygenase